MAKQFRVGAESCLRKDLHGHFLDMGILQKCIIILLFSTAFEGTKHSFETETLAKKIRRLCLHFG
jgi:hypothetical protein